MQKILIADDDDSILILYADILGQAGYEVHVTEDGAGAIVKYQAVRPDLVILDFEIPAGGGLGVLKELRGMSVQPVPVLIATGHEESAIVDALKFYLVGYLKKPFTRAMLLGKVREMLEDIPQPAPETEGSADNSRRDSK